MLKSPSSMSIRNYLKMLISPQPHAASNIHPFPSPPTTWSWQWPPSDGAGSNFSPLVELWFVYFLSSNAKLLLCFSLVQNSICWFLAGVTGSLWCLQFLPVNHLHSQKENACVLELNVSVIRQGSWAPCETQLAIKFEIIISNIHWSNFGFPLFKLVFIITVCQP